MLFKLTIFNHTGTNISDTIVYNTIKSKLKTISTMLVSVSENENRNYKN